MGTASASVLTVWDVIGSQAVAASATVAESVPVETAAGAVSVDAVAADDFFARLESESPAHDTSAALSTAVPLWQNDDLLLATLAAPAAKQATASSSASLASGRRCR